MYIYEALTIQANASQFWLETGSIFWGNKNIMLTLCWFLRMSPCLDLLIMILGVLQGAPWRQIAWYNMTFSSLNLLYQQHNSVLASSALRDSAWVRVQMNICSITESWDCWQIQLRLYSMISGSKQRTIARKQWSWKQSRIINAAYLS